ncbi:MAG: 16S rRNA (adenine(1518)-N(6)/adenine(1519)-N(6))-dimethyltransferase RsmA [Rhodospirillaceae bacterium]
MIPLREVIARHGLDARKALGQHFLLDMNITAKIARAAGDLSGVSVIEIGPGPGGLTRALLDTKAREIVAIERDDRCVTALAELADESAGRLRIVSGDALVIDAAELVEAPRVIVANLPYNIATPLLLGWLGQIERYESLILMFQKEVADRLCAPPGGKTYGRLSVACQWRAVVKPLFTLPARAFTPPPAVDSSVVRLTPRANPEPAPAAAFERVTAAAFGQRRKMLRASLRCLGDPESLLAEAELPPTARAEEINVAGFAALARALARRATN